MNVQVKCFMWYNINHVHLKIQCWQRIYQIVTFLEIQHIIKYGKCLLSQYTNTSETDFGIWTKIRNFLGSLNSRAKTVSAHQSKYLIAILFNHWWTALTKPRLLFSRAGYASGGRSLLSVCFIITSWCVNPVLLWVKVDLW